MGTITIRSDDALEADLECIAQAQHRTNSDLVRDVPRRYTTVELFELARQEPRPYNASNLRRLQTSATTAGANCRIHLSRAIASSVARR